MSTDTTIKFAPDITVNNKPWRSDNGPSTAGPIQNIWDCDYEEVTSPKEVRVAKRAIREELTLAPRHIERPALIEASKVIFNHLSALQDQGIPHVLSYIINDLTFDEAGVVASALQRFFEENNEARGSFSDNSVLDSVSFSIMLFQQLALPTSDESFTDSRMDAAFHKKTLLRFLFDTHLLTREVVEYTVRLVPTTYEAVNSIWHEFSGTDKRHVERINKWGARVTDPVLIDAPKPPLEETKENAAVVVQILKKMKPINTPPIIAAAGEDVEVHPVEQKLLQVKAEDDRRAAWNCYYYLWENWDIGNADWEQGVYDFFVSQNEAFGEEFNSAHSVLFAMVTCSYFSDLDRDVSIAILKFLCSKNLITKDLIQEAKQKLSYFRYTINHLVHEDLLPERGYSEYESRSQSELSSFIDSLAQKRAKGPHAVYTFLRENWNQDYFFRKAIAEFLTKEEQIVINSLESEKKMPANGISPLHLMIEASAHLDKLKYSFHEREHFEKVLDIIEWIFSNFQFYTDEFDLLLRDYEVSKRVEGSFSQSSGDIGDILRSFEEDLLLTSPQGKGEAVFDTEISPVVSQNGGSPSVLSVSGSPLQGDQLFSSPPQRRNAIYGAPASFDLSSGSFVDEKLEPSPYAVLDGDHNSLLVDLRSDHVDSRSSVLGLPQQEALDSSETVFSQRSLSPQRRNAVSLRSPNEDHSVREGEALDVELHSLLQSSQNNEKGRLSPFASPIVSVTQIDTPPEENSLLRPIRFEGHYPAMAGRSSPQKVEMVDEETITPIWNAVQEFHNSLFLTGGESVSTIVKVIFFWIGMIATLSILYWGFYWQASALDAKTLEGRQITVR